MKPHKKTALLEFNSVDSKHKHFSGSKVVVLKVYNRPDKDHDAEVLPMYDVRVFGTKEVLHVFHDEIIPLPEKVLKEFRRSIEKFRVDLTPTKIRALDFLKNTSDQRPMTARRFAELMWPGSNMHTSSKNQGNGATRGKAAWLCGGSYLGKLRKMDLVSNFSSPGYYITSKGLEKLNESATTPKTRKNEVNSSSK